MFKQTASSASFYFQNELLTNCLKQLSQDLLHKLMRFLGFSSDFSFLRPLYAKNVVYLLHLFWPENGLSYLSGRRLDSLTFNLLSGARVGKPGMYSIIYVPMLTKAKKV